MPERKYMPIHSTPLAIRMDLLNKHQARRNHSQSLDRLAERGGLSPTEILAIMESESYGEKYRQMGEVRALGKIMFSTDSATTEYRREVAFDEDVPTDAVG